MDEVLVYEPDPTGESSNKLGVLTRTIVKSPVINWIIPARIRSRQHNDIVFVGDDFIEVKELKHDGQLTTVLDKRDFGARIRAANGLKLDSPSIEKTSLSHDIATLKNSDNTFLLENMLVLVLDTNQLCFLRLHQASTGEYETTCYIYPIPSFDQAVYQPGQHLAIDPYSRALAVAANERELVLYATRVADTSLVNDRPEETSRCPVAAERPLQIDGIIRHMEFLFPPGGDDSHIILLLIIIDKHRIKATWIDWYSESTLQTAQIHPGLSLDSTISTPSLLIPLCNATFILVNGNEVRLWRNILAGSASALHTQRLEGFVLNDPGGCPRKPTWTTWCRVSDAKISQGFDYDAYFLLREDGALLSLHVTEATIFCNYIGTVGCYAGNALAFVSGDRESSFLLVGGDTSAGCIVSFEKQTDPLDIDGLSMENMEIVEKLPNWASVIDMVTTDLSPGRTKRPRDGIFVTSSRQPYGAITELRSGLEARISLYFELPGLQSVTNVWTIPYHSGDFILLVLSSPNNTRLLVLPSNAQMEGVDELDESRITLDTSHRTISAAHINDSAVLQVTQRSICSVPDDMSRIESPLRMECPSNCSIIAATIGSDGVVLALERGDEFLPDPVYSLVLYTYQMNDNTGSQHLPCITRRLDTVLTNEPLSLARVDLDSPFILISSSDRSIMIFSLLRDGTFSYVRDKPLPAFHDGQGICDHMAILRSKSDNHRCLVICGLRNGRLHSFVLDETKVNVVDEHTVILSRASVTLQQSHGNALVAYAISESDCCRISWNGRSASSLSIQSIWVTDKERPHLNQTAVSACTQMPAGGSLATSELAEALVLISGDEFLITDLMSEPAAVPRQIPVSGTPSRLIYAEQQRCFVCASMRHEVRQFQTSHSKPEERRQLWPVVEFIPTWSSEPSFTYNLQPGERVYTILEWSFKLDQSKTYSFILVGGSYMRSSGTQRGRIIFLQPLNKNWEVCGVKEGRTSNFDAPIYALALWDDLTYVACSGKEVLIYRFSVAQRKWEPICSPFRLTSVGVNIVVSKPFISISTTEDSMTVLSLKSNPESGVGTMHELVHEYTAPKADALLSHVVPTVEQDGKNIPELQDLLLTTSKRGQVIGMCCSRKDADLAPPCSMKIAFTAQLPRSLTRLHQSHLRPRWRSTPPPGVLTGNIIGCASDGALVGVALLSEATWKRLSWLQYLCEISHELSPFSPGQRLPSDGDDTYAQNEQPIPIGLSKKHSEVGSRIASSGLNSKHVDGDILMRARRPGAAKSLEAVVRRLSARQDSVGEWIQANFDEELAAVDEMVQSLEPLLDLWL